MTHIPTELRKEIERVEELYVKIAVEILQLQRLQTEIFEILFESKDALADGKMPDELQWLKELKQLKD